MFGRHPFSTQAICGSPTKYAPVGSYAIASVGARLLCHYQVVATPATYTITGFDVELYDTDEGHLNPRISFFPYRTTSSFARVKATVSFTSS